MDSSDIDKVKAALGDETIDILNSVFLSSKTFDGFPPGVKKNRFRADNPYWMETLDNKIGTSGFFLTVDKGYEYYRVKGYSLPLLQSPHAIYLLELMDRAFSYFKEEYYHSLESAAFTAGQIADVLEVEDEAAAEMLHYMLDVDGWNWGHSGDFPAEDNSTVTISESILKHTSFADLIMQVYDWHYISAPQTHAGDLFTDRNIMYEGFFSPTEASAKPSWLEKLDHVKKDLIGEIDASLQKGLRALPTMGLRALIDLVIVEKIGDEGSFPKKLTGLVENGYISLQQKELLNSVLEVGHAASHRAFFPESDGIRTCVDVIKHMMHAVYDLQPRTEVLNQKTPKRPKKIKVNKGA